VLCRQVPAHLCGFASFWCSSLAWLELWAGSNRACRLHCRGKHYHLEPRGTRTLCSVEAETAQVTAYSHMPLLLVAVTDRSSSVPQDLCWTAYLCCCNSAQRRAGLLPYEVLSNLGLYDASIASISTVFRSPIERLSRAPGYTQLGTTPSRAASRTAPDHFCIPIRPYTSPSSLLSLRPRSQRPAVPSFPPMAARR
jgi:hypothetical protein